MRLPFAVLHLYARHAPQRCSPQHCAAIDMHKPACITSRIVKKFVKFDLHACTIRVAMQVFLQRRTSPWHSRAARPLQTSAALSRKVSSYHMLTCSAHLLKFLGLRHGPSIAPT